MKISLSNRLSQIIAERGINQSELARMCQPAARKHGVTISAQSISKYVTGKNFPTDEVLAAIAETLRVPEIWLMGYEPSEGLSQEELNLCSAWRLCSDKERETIAFILRDYGFVLQPRNIPSSDIA